MNKLPFSDRHNLETPHGSYVKPVELRYFAYCIAVLAAGLLSYRLLFAPASPVLYLLLLINLAAALACLAFIRKNALLPVLSVVLFGCVALTIVVGVLSQGLLRSPAMATWILLPVWGTFVFGHRVTFPIMATIAVILLLSGVYELYNDKVTTVSYQSYWRFSVFWNLINLVWISVMCWYFSRRFSLLRGVLEKLALTDALTGAPNRRSCEAALERNLSIAQRQQQSLAVIIIDVDLFKQINDQYGHPTGDRALQLITDVIDSSLQRGTDFFGRFGGDEFIIVLLDVDAGQCQQVIDRIDTTLALRTPDADLQLPAIALSYGVACTVPKPDTSVADLIRIADRNLYRQKANRQVPA